MFGGRPSSPIGSRFLVAALLATLAAAPVSADRLELEAKALFNEGTRLVERGEFAAAAQLFRTAYARFPNPTILWNLAAVLEQLGRLAEAADTYEQFIRHPRTDQAKRIKGAQALALLEVQIGKLKIEVTEPDCRVVLDGTEIGTGMTFVVRLDPGSHDVVAEKAGLASAAAKVDVVAGGERTVTLRPGAPRVAPVAPAPTAVESPAPTATPEPASAAPTEIVATVEPEHEPEQEGRAGRIGLTVRGEADARTLEGGPSAGLTFGASSWLELSGLALIQQSKGARLAASAYLSPSALAPFVRLGVPVFFVDGARPGVHAAAGLLWDVTDFAGLVVDAGVEYLPTVPEPFHKASIVVAAGVVARPLQ
jgi:tetratricopeptide (TPR) repeat protein